MVLSLIVPCFISHTQKKHYFILSLLGSNLVISIFLQNYALNLDFHIYLHRITKSNLLKFNNIPL